MTQPLALVTGGAQRVGRAVANLLCERGFRVVITYRNSIAQAQEFARTTGQKAFQADFGVQRDLDRIVSTLHDSVDRLDLVVNTASLYLRDDQPGAEQQMQVNCTAPVQLARRLASLLRDSGGAVVNFTDILAERPMRGYGLYCMSKAALSSATLVLARELAPGVRVNAIAPGVIDWPTEFTDEQKSTYLKKVPLARAGTPREAAELVHFLATGATYLTGQIIRIDGGRSIVW